MPDVSTQSLAHRPNTVAADPIVNREEWVKDAACGDAPPELFFPTSSREERLFAPEMRKICSGCPVREECLRYAIEHREAGSWGGYTYAERVREGLQRRSV